MKAFNLIKEFKGNELGPFIEVPCSFLAPLISELMCDNECEVLNPVNEGIAMGMAAGSFLATRKIPIVLTQNSGLCNTLNAFTSLNQIYKIPALYVISWRGEPHIKDAPQHLIIGEKLESIMNTFDLPYEILSERYYKKQIKSLVSKIRKNKRPGALILKKGIVEKEIVEIKEKKKLLLSRSDAIDAIVTSCDGKGYFVTTTGYISRETMHALSTNGIEEKNPVFYMMGSMGHALPIGLGISSQVKKNKKIIVIDGDGGCLMHLGAMASVGKNNNLLHIVLDNGAYASVGGQPAVSSNIDLKKIALGCGYTMAKSVSKKTVLKKYLTDALSKNGPSFLRIVIDDKNESPKLRVSEKYTCEEIKELFLSNVSS